jgi:hypothetical protein
MLARTLLITLSAVLTNNVVLADYSSQEAGLFKRALIQERQSQAFTPSTDSGSGTTCVAAFGPGWEPCGPVQCYNPGDGQVCCEEGCKDPFSISGLLRVTSILTCESKSDGCPKKSFCLTKGLCCPAVRTARYPLIALYMFSSNALLLPPGSPRRYLRRPKRRFPLCRVQDERSLDSDQY